MYQYFGFNILLSLMIFGYLYLLKTAPFRVRFRLAILALFSWLIPYDLINGYFNQSNVPLSLPNYTELNLTIKSAITTKITTQASLSLLKIMQLLSIIGLMVYINDLMALKKYLKSLKLSFYKTINTHNIYCVKNNGCAFTSGILKPRIYISEKHLTSSTLDSIIIHELQHIKNHDNYWLVAITFVQRVLWWNPLVYLLANKARNYIELSCDEACNDHKNGKYQKDLAKLLLQKSNKTNPLLSHFFGKNKNNIYRIKQLSKEFKMNKKNKALIYSTALIPLILTLLVSTSSLSSVTNTSDKEWENMPIKANQAKIVLDAHLYLNESVNKSVNKEKSNYDLHKSYAVNMVINLDEEFGFNSPKLNGFKVEFFPTRHSENSILFDSDIKFTVFGEMINLTPKIAINRKDTGHVIVNDENGQYRFELYITVRD